MYKTSALYYSLLSLSFFFSACFKVVVVYLPFFLSKARQQLLSAHSQIIVYCRGSLTMAFDTNLFQCGGVAQKPCFPPQIGISAFAFECCRFSIHHPTTLNRLGLRWVEATIYSAALFVAISFP